MVTGSVAPLGEELVASLKLHETAGGVAGGWWRGVPGIGWWQCARPLFVGGCR